MNYFKMLSLVTLVSLTSVATGLAAEASKPVVTINGIHLYEADLNQEVQALLPMARSYHSGVSSEKMKEVRQQAMVALIDRELKYQDALARKLKLSKEDLEAERESLKARFKKQGDLDKIVAGAGFTPEGFNRFLERKLLSERVEKQVVDEKVVITDEAVKAYYDQNKSRYLKPEEYRASQILVKVSPSALDEERAQRTAKAESILKKLQAGADFADLASQESDDLSRIKGGDLGYFHAGQTDPHFDQTVKGMKVGEISGIVQTLDGFHIIKLVEKKEARQLPFAEVKEKIQQQLKDAERAKLFDQWMAGLKAKAKISYPSEG